MSETTLERTYKLLVKAGNKGVSNYEFPKHRILRYSSTIKQLRDEYKLTIDVERQYLPNGRATNVYKYYLIED